MGEHRPDAAIRLVAVAVGAATPLVPASHQWIARASEAALEAVADLVRDSAWTQQTRAAMRMNLRGILAELPGVDPDTEALPIARGVVATVSVVRRWAGLEVL